jgi:hypothetical protein
MACLGVFLKPWTGESTELSALMSPLRLRSCCCWGRGVVAWLLLPAWPLAEPWLLPGHCWGRPLPQLEGLPQLPPDCSLLLLNQDRSCSRALRPSGVLLAAVEPAHAVNSGRGSDKGRAQISVGRGRSS